ILPALSIKKCAPVCLPPAYASSVLVAVEESVRCSTIAWTASRLPCSIDAYSLTSIAGSTSLPLSSVAIGRPPLEMRRRPMAGAARWKFRRTMLQPPAGGVKQPASGRRARRLPRRPRPLEVVAAEPAVDVDHLADEVEAGHEFRLHRAGGEAIGVDAAESDLGGAVAFRAAGGDRPRGELRADLRQFGLAVLAHRAVAEPLLAQPLREALRQHLAEHGLQFGQRPRRALVDQPGADVEVRQQVEAQVVAGLPVRGNLQDRRSADAAMGEQQSGAKTLPAHAGLHP